MFVDVGCEELAGLERDRGAVSISLGNGSIHEEMGMHGMMVVSAVIVSIAIASISGLES